MTIWQETYRNLVVFMKLFGVHQRKRNYFIPQTLALNKRKMYFI